MTDYKNPMELFDSDGHLTDDSFRQLIDGLLDSTQSLEVSEHLSFCDQCVSRYTDLLCGDVSDTGALCLEGPMLIAPPEPLAPSVMERLNRKARVIYWNRIASMVVAASFALVFWIGGFFTPHMGEAPAPFLKDTRSPVQTIGREAGKITDSFMEHLDSLRTVLEDFGRFSLSDLLPKKQAPKR